MVTNDPKISAVWNNAYPLSMHDMPEKVDRQKRAMYNATPLLIDPINMSAFFWPSADSFVSQIYRTSLTYCTCPDHQKHPGPCKHIYRLFYELTHIPYENSGIIDVDSSITNSLSELSDSDLYNGFWHILHPSDVAIQLTNAAKRLVKSGVFQESEPTDEEYAKLLNTMTKDQLILDLQSHGIDGFYKSWSKVRLVAWVIEHQRPYLRSKFKDYAILSPASSILPWIDGIKISQRSYRIYVSDQSFSLGYTPYKFQ